MAVRLPLASLIKRFALLGLIVAAAILVTAREPGIRTDRGTVEGANTRGVESFLGIPFAAPPIGEQRWRPPRPAAPWDGLRLAKRFGPDCEQTPLPDDFAPLRSTLSEDCLYLNVWRPAGGDPAVKLPVVFWIHGGGLMSGGSSSAVFDGGSFARKGVIFVSANYRLGRFGFFAVPQLSREDGGANLVGNYGLMDQMAALQWVQRNIAAFGGDPDNVTVLGESAGGASIHVLLTSPLSKGLFAKAIIQSGLGRSSPVGDRRLKSDLPGLPSLETLGLAFAREHGISGDDPAILQKLRALPASEVGGGLNMVTYYQTDQGATFGGPALDDRLYVELPQETYLAGRQPRLPLIVGVTSADFGLENTRTKDGLFTQFGPAEAQARAVYDPDGQADVNAVIAAASSDWTMVEPARFVARQFARRGGPVFAYRFSYVAKSKADTWKTGAPHATDVPYALNTMVAAYGDALTVTDARVARMMNSYWANFAKTGDPNGPGLPPWPAFDPAADQLMDFASDGRPRAVRDPWKARLDLVEALR